MKELDLWQYLSITGVWVILFWMVGKSYIFLFDLILTKVLKRDLEQEAIDRVFKNRNIQPGTVVVIKYKNGVTVTMSKD